MKRPLTLLTLSLSAVIFALTASAEGGNELNYAIKEDGTAVITGSDYVQGGDLVIPSEIEGYTVTEIGEYAFVNNSGISSVVLPDTVKVIGNSAFSGCKRLESINFPEGLTEIAQFSFSNCSYLKEITIPDSVTELGLEAFSECYYLKSVTMGSGLKEIREAAFRNCHYLTNVKLGENVRKIGASAFSDVGLKTIYIPVSVTEISSYAFYDTGYFTVNYSGGETQWNKIDIDYGNSDLKDKAEIKYMRDAEGNVDNTVMRKNLTVIAVYVAAAALILTPVIIFVSKNNSTCKGCGAPKEEGAQFCGKCGTKY